MATPLTANQVVNALKSEGVKIVEYKSWRTHNRNTAGAWGPVHGVMIHHTVTSGTASSVELCYAGHSTLPGPLCHAVGTKDGSVYLTGHGRANHAGSGSRAVLDAVVAEHDRLPPAGSGTDGNARFYGIELVNRGDGEDPWPEAQVEAAARWAAALCRAHGWSARSVIGHKEWQAGKVDPRPTPGSADISMPAVRARVAELLKQPPGTDTNSEKDMPKRYLVEASDYTRTVQPATWTTLNFNRTYNGTKWVEKNPEPSVLLGPCHFTASLAVRVDGLRRGDELQVRLARYREKPFGGSWERVGVLPIDSPTHDGGRAHFTQTWTSYLSSTRKERLRAEIQHFGPAPITVDWARCESLYWPA